MTDSTRTLSTRQRTVRGITVASVGIGLALGVGAGVASADPATTPSPSQVRAAASQPSGPDAASIANSVQHQAADARANAGRNELTQTGIARPAAAVAAVNTPNPASAVPGSKPNTPGTPIKDAIVNLIKTSLRNQLTGGFGQLLGPSR